MSEDPLINSVLHQIDEDDINEFSTDISSPLLSRKSQIDASVTVDGPSNNKSKRIARICLIVIAVIAVLIGILVPVIFYAIIPNYVRSEIDRSQLSVHELYFHSMFPDRIECQMNFSLTRLEYDFKFEKVHVVLSHNGTRIGSLKMQELTSFDNQTGGDLTFVKNVTISVDNDYSLSLLLQDLLVRNATIGLEFDKYDLTVYDVPVLTTIRMSNRRFKKYFLVRTFEQFKPVDISRIQVVDIRNKDELTMWIQLKLHMTNPSILHFYLNYYTFKLSYKYKNEKYVPIGLVSAERVYVMKEACSYAYLSISSKYFKDSKDAISEFLTSIINHKKLPVLIQSHSHSNDYKYIDNSQLTINENKNHLSWLENGLKNLTIEMTLSDYPQYFIAISNIQMQKLEMKIEREFRPVLSGNLAAKVSMPAEFKNANITHVRMQFNICFYDQDYCKHIGRVETRWTPASLSEFEYDKERVLNVSLNPDMDETVAFIQVEDRFNYMYFLREMIVRKKVEIKVSGHADAELDGRETVKRMGSGVHVSGIPFESVVSLEGMDSTNTDLNRFYFLGNLDLFQVQEDQGLRLTMPDTWMRRIGRQVGLIVKQEMTFDMFYQFDVAKKAKVGVISLPSLRLNDHGDCLTKLNHTLLNRTIEVDVPYCPVNVEGVARSDVQFDAEVCETPELCPGRQFISHYLTAYTLLNRSVDLELKATILPADLHMARDVLQFNTKLPGFIPAVSKNLVSRISVQPGDLKMLSRGYLNCWLDFLNPFRVPLRFYYIHVDTYLSGSFIGTLHLNMTNYDPFALKPGYIPVGHPKRKRVRDDDPDGPHADQQCIDHGDCQIAPIDLPVSSEYKRSRRLEVTFMPSLKMIRLWKILFENNANTTVTIRGKVLVGIGSEPYPHERNDTTSPPIDDADPYWKPPKHVHQLITWIDYGQTNTNFTLFKK